MPGRQSVEDMIADATKISDVWKANASFSLGAVTLDKFKAAVAGVQSATTTVESMRTELSGLITERDSKTRELSDLVSRALSGVRATFGPDSMQYKQAGGTPRSERKSPRRSNGDSESDKS